MSSGSSSRNGVFQFQAPTGITDLSVTIICLYGEILQIDNAQMDKQPTHHPKDVSILLRQWASCWPNG